jgi:hypothetical protein
LDGAADAFVQQCCRYTAMKAVGVALMFVARSQNG